MEGDISAAPRLASEFYKQSCWASDALVEGEAQAHTSADNGDLHLAGNEASATTASDPIKEGQVKPMYRAANEDLQAISLKGKISVVNEDLHRSTAQCGIFQEEASHHLAQAHAVASASKQQDALFNLTPAASVFIPLSIAAHTKPSPSAFTPSTLANPTTSPSHQHRLHAAIRASSLHVFSPRASNASAIPVLKPNHSATSTHSSMPTILVILSSSSTAMLTISTIPSLPMASPCSQWHDEVMTTSSATNHSSPPGGFSRLRAKASPWKPGKPTLPSILIGDVPTPLFQSGDISPSSFSMVLPQPRPPLAVGTYKVQPCSYCGHLPQFQHVFKCGPNLPPTPLTKHLEVFRLRGRSVLDQAQASRGQPVHNTATSDCRPTRPKFKMKKELVLLQLQKENLDPG